MQLQQPAVKLLQFRTHVEKPPIIGQRRACQRLPSRARRARVAVFFQERLKHSFLEPGVTPATDMKTDQPGRREPRAVKRRPKPYQLLNRPRHLVKALQHRGKYRKNP